MDPYALLGVSPGSSEHDVRRAYRRIVLSLHPDLQPEHLRVQSGRRLQQVNAARAHALAEIRSRAAAEDGPTRGFVVPDQRRPPDESDQASRRAERQAWLHRQQRHIDAWNSGRQTREHSRREGIEHRQVQRSRRLRRGRSWGLVPLLLIVALQVSVVLGVVHGVGSALTFAATQDLALVQQHGDLDLREVLALLGSWRS